MLMASENAVLNVLKNISCIHVQVYHTIIQASFMFIMCARLTANV